MSAGFVELTSDQLNTMGLDELKAYYKQVSDMVDQQTSTINADIMLQTQYQYLISQSQSTIDGIGTQQIINSNAIIISIQATAGSQNEVSTNTANLLAYDSTIRGENSNIENLSSQIYTLNIESNNINTALTGSDTVYASTATAYSTLYQDFAAKDAIYQQSLADIATTSSYLVSSIVAEAYSYAVLQSSVQNYYSTSQSLSSLIIDGGKIHSTVVQYRIDEKVAQDAVTSTNNGLITLSSYYITALLNRQYVQSLSTQSGLTSSFNSATTNYNILKSGTDSAAANTAQLALTSITTMKTSADSTVTSLQSQTSISLNDSYNINVLAAQANVDAETQNVSTYTGRYNDDIANITYYSSLYEQATRDINSSIAGFQTYSTYYQSSVNGSNALMKLVDKDSSTFSEQVTNLGILSKTISSLYIDYSNYTSTYNGLVLYSTTILKDAIRDSTIALKTYSTFYDSTSAAISKLYTDSNITLKHLVSTQVNIDTYSTLIERHTANLLVYAATLDASYAQEELGTMKYRETIVREKHIRAQKDYDQAVIDEIQRNSTNGISTATNLNTPAISIAYTTLKTVEEHVNKYSEIYDLYNAQSTNQGLMLSTTVGYSNSYTTLLSSQMAAKIYPNDTATVERKVARERVYNTERKSIDDRNQGVTLGYQDIYARKSLNDQAYNSLFSPSELSANTSTISSFLIQGYNAVIQLSQPPLTPEQLLIQERLGKTQSILRRAKKVAEDAQAALQAAVNADAAGSTPATAAALEAATNAAAQAADDEGVAQAEVDAAQAEVDAAQADPNAVDRPNPPTASIRPTPPTASIRPTPPTASIRPTPPTASIRPTPYG
jgi:hypothetical protein